MKTVLISPVAVLGFACTCMAADQSVLPVRENYLLLDSRVVAEADNARLAVGTVKKNPANPLLVEDQPWERDISHMYANVLFDEEQQCYKLWYYTKLNPLRAGQEDLVQQVAPGPLASHDPAKGQCALLYAISKDGLRWEKPALHVYHYKKKPTNIVVWGECGTGVFKDPNDADPSRRYKLITGRLPHGTLDVAFSPDGIRWSKRQEAAEARGDTHNNALWSPELKKYVAFTREFPDNIRTVLRMESEDFIHWTKPEEVMRGSVPAAQTYSMPVFRYAGVYLGLVAIYQVTGDRRVRTELAWSPDTKTWHRIDEGAALIPFGEKQGDRDWGCIYAAASPVVLKDEIRIYYAGAPAPHSWQPGYFCLATLRPDGWAGFTQKDESSPARVLTQPLACTGKTLRVTADVAAGGSVKVTVLDTTGKAVVEGQPITATMTAGVAANLAGQDGRTVRVQFEISKAKVYSFAFGQ
ncbi:MAG: hypothetical protein WAX69_16350 [Victivallales bacterium]